MSLKEKYQVNNVFVSAVTPENVSRQQLLAWVNDCLQSNFTKIEEMATGAAYCQLTDRLFPGSVPLRKVKWNSRSDLDWINNWKLVQNAWHELGITKPIQVQILMRAKFQENFEFLQWFKRFYDYNDGNYEYDALAMRNNEELPSSSGMKTNSRTTMRAGNLPERRRTVAPATSTPRAAAAAPTRASMAPAARPATTATRTAAPRLDAAAEAKYKKEIAELKDQIAKWEDAVGTIERERDFYYQRLHKLELLCNELGEGQTLTVEQVLNVLIQDDEQDLNAFEAVEDEVRSQQTNEDHQSNATFDVDEPTAEPHHDNTYPVEDPLVTNGNEQQNGTFEIQKEVSLIDLELDDKSLHLAENGKKSPVPKEPSVTAHGDVDEF